MECSSHAVVARWGYRLALASLRMWWAIRRPRSDGVRCVLRDGEAFVLVRHSYGDSRWMLPGGRIRRGESALETAAREMSQELAVAATQWRELGYCICERAAATGGRRARSPTAGMAPITSPPTCARRRSPLAPASFWTQAGSRWSDCPLTVRMRSTWRSPTGGWTDAPRTRRDAGLAVRPARREAGGQCRLSERVLLSRPGVSGFAVADRSAGARAYLGPRPLWPVTRWLMGRSAGDDSGRSVLLCSPVNCATHAPTASRSARKRPRKTSPVSLSSASKVICARCTSNPARIAIRGLLCSSEVPHRESLASSGGGPDRKRPVPKGSCHLVDDSDTSCRTPPRGGRRSTAPRRGLRPPGGP